MNKLNTKSTCLVGIRKIKVKHIGGIRGVSDIKNYIYKILPKVEKGVIYIQNKSKENPYNKNIKTISSNMTLQMFKLNRILSAIEESNRLFSFGTKKSRVRKSRVRKSRVRKSRVRN